MRKTLLIAFAVAVVAAPAAAAVWDLVLTNSSGKEIKLVEVAPSGSAVWQPNIVDEGVVRGPVKPGGRMTVHFDKTPSQCRFDLKATFADDTTAVWNAINVCDNAFVVVKFGASGAPAFTAS